MTLLVSLVATAKSMLFLAQIKEGSVKQANKLQTNKNKTKNRHRTQQAVLLYCLSLRYSALDW